MYLSNIQSIPEIQASYQTLFERYCFYEKHPEKVKDIVENTFNQITSWKISKGRLAANLTPYPMELTGAGFKTPRMLKKPFVSLKESAAKKYTSYAFCEDRLLLEIPPLQDEYYNLLTCNTYEANLATKFSFNFRYFDIQDNRLTFPAHSVFDNIAVCDYFWLSDTMQVAVSINEDLGYWTDVFVYDEKNILQYVVQTIHYHDSVRKKNKGRERSEFVSIFHYDDKGEFSHTTTAPSITK